MLTVEKRNSLKILYIPFLIFFILYFNIRYCSLVKTEDILTSVEQ
jgi:hypothetical protein